MPSAITGLIGGFQGASAAHNAAKAAAGGYNDAGATVTNAASSVNPLITSAATTAGNNAVNTATGAGAGVTTSAGQANGMLDPYMTAGKGAANTLSGMLAPGGSLMQNFNGVTMQNDPGYQFRMDQGAQALQRSEAANGSVNGGGAMKAMSRYGQDYASNEYQNAFSRFQQSNAQRYAELSGTAGMGMQASGQAGANTIGAAQYSGNANINASQYQGNANMSATDLAAKNSMGAAEYKGNAQIGAGNAIASGDIGAANAWNGALSGIGNGVTGALMGGFGGGGGFNMGGFLSGIPGGGGAPGAPGGAPTVDYGNGTGSWG